MKKTIFLVFTFLVVSFNSYSQCYVPALSSHCEYQTQKLDDTSNDYYAVFQANDQCVYLKWNFPFYELNYLVGLKVFIHGGGVFELIELFNFCTGYSWNQTLPNPFYSNSGWYVYYNNEIVDPEAVMVEYIYSEVDWGACTYEGMKYKDYFGYLAPTCTPTGSFQDENNDFGNIDINIPSKATGVYPTIVADKINIIESQEIKNIDIVDINGRIVKKYKTDKYYSGTYNLSDLNSGIYIVRITTIDNIRKNYKIIKE